jgi:hypothetical protein
MFYLIYSILTLSNKFPPRGIRRVELKNYYNVFICSDNHSSVKDINKSVLKFYKLVKKYEKPPKHFIKEVLTLASRKASGENMEDFKPQFEKFKVDVSSRRGHIYLNLWNIDEKIFYRIPQFIHLKINPRRITTNFLSRYQEIIRKGFPEESEEFNQKLNKVFGLDKNKLECISCYREVISLSHDGRCLRCGTRTVTMKYKDEKETTKLYGQLLDRVHALAKHAA